MAFILIIFNFATAAIVGILVMSQLSLLQNLAIVAFGLGLYLLGDYVDTDSSIRVNQVREHHAR